MLGPVRVALLLFPGFDSGASAVGDDKKILLGHSTPHVRSLYKLPRLRRGDLK